MTWIAPARTPQPKERDIKDGINRLSLVSWDHLDMREVPPRITCSHPNDGSTFEHSTILPIRQPPLAIFDLRRIVRKKRDRVNWHWSSCISLLVTGRRNEWNVGFTSTRLTRIPRCPL